MTVSLSPVFQDAQLDIQGNPAAGYKLFTYAANTSTKVPVFTTLAGNVPHTNPIILNTRGEPPDPIWITDGAKLDFLLTTPGDTDPPLSPIRTFMDVSGIGDTAATSQIVSEWVMTGLTPTFVGSGEFSIFSVPGDQRSVYEAPPNAARSGRRVRGIIAGGAVYGTIVTSVFSSGVTTVSARTDSGFFNSSLTRVDVGIVSAVNTSLPIIAPEFSIQAISTSGVTVWTKPAGCRVIRVLLAGGGASGAGTAALGTGSTGSAGGGGGSGEFKEMVMSAASLTTVNVTVGAGAAGNFGAAGTNGSTTSFGTILTALGGFAAPVSGVQAGTGVTGQGGPGGSGGIGANISGGGGHGMDGLVFNGIQALSGRGGDSFWGAGGQAVFRSGSGQTTGNIGGSPGAGGSGAAGLGVCSAASGGAGATGICVVQQYF